MENVVGTQFIMEMPLTNLEFTQQEATILKVKKKEMLLIIQEQYIMEHRSQTL